MKSAYLNASCFLEIPLIKSLLERARKLGYPGLPIWEARINAKCGNYQEALKIIDRLVSNNNEPTEQLKAFKLQAKVYSKLLDLKRAGQSIAGARRSLFRL